jgi:2-polyprenyl-3-methyl-5-hydroxy-6-metoxy-1,4-benzoquinol methylase
MTKEYIELNNKITENLLRTQNQSEKDKIKKKRHLPIVSIISKYSDKKLPLLDIGAREGNLLKLLSDNGFKTVMGVDASEDALKLLREQGFTGINVDAQNFDLKKKFGTVIMSHVLEHCPNGQAVVDNAYKHLEDNGVLYVEVPRQPKIPMPTKAGHYHHYDELVEFLDLFDLAKWRLLFANYERGGNKGNIRAVFRKIKL